MPRAGFEPATKRPQTCSLDRAAAGIGLKAEYKLQMYERRCSGKYPISVRMQYGKHFRSISHNSVKCQCKRCKEPATFHTQIVIIRIKITRQKLTSNTYRLDSHHQWTTNM